MKKLIGILALLLALVMVFAACGETTPPETNPPATNPPATDPVETRTAANIKLENIVIVLSP